MKNKIFMLLTSLIVVAAGCKKDGIKTSPLASLTISNTIINGQVGHLNTALRDSVGIMTYKQFTINAGDNAPVKVYASNTPNSPYYNTPLNAPNGGYYTLFLAGNASTTIDAVMVKESYSNYTDSTFAVRFANMSPSSSPVNVYLSTGSTPEASSIAYKGLSNFVKYSADYKHTTYTFQFKDASTNVLLGSVTYTGTTNTTGLPRFQNITLVYKGITGGAGTNALGITRINHF